MRTPSALTFAIALTLSSVGAGTVTLATPSDAFACGGCFVPPENNSVVTDHRMVLAVTPTQTTLYDQIRYQGSPDSFAWVLPIRGEAKIGISSDAVFAALDAFTSVQVIAPPTNCPTIPSNCRSVFSPAAAGAEDSASGVQVLKQETVGPYETVQLRSADPAALSAWLGRNGFSIPVTIAPIVSAYVAEKFDFLALKLVPGKGIQSMRPVRVTTDGATPSLPLRMVAAGTGPNVGIGLWVVGAGRWEPQNFPTFTVKAEELTWNWAQSASDFKQVRAKKAGLLGAGAFEQESSITASPSNLATQIASTAGNYDLIYGPGAGGATPDSRADYQDQRDANGAVVKTAKAVFDEDMQSLFGRPVAFNQNSGSVRITRMRADLPQASLANDLVLQATQDQSELGRTRQVTREQGEPSCQVFAGCKVSGSAPRSQAIAQTYARSSSCAVATTTSPLGLGAVCIGLGFVTLAATRLRRRRN
jgi:Uncharacterized protein conserved in bacteria (DUF2330)